MVRIAHHGSSGPAVVEGNRLDGEGGRNGCAYLRGECAPVDPLAVPCERGDTLDPWLRCPQPTLDRCVRMTVPPSSNDEMRDAQQVLGQTLSAMVSAEHSSLLIGAGASVTPFSRAVDPAWLLEQFPLETSRWRTADPRVLGTLWWYSASVWLQAPSLASLVATGRPLSPRMADLQMHRLPDGRLTGATSSAVLVGDPISELGQALGESFAAIIQTIGRVCRINERSLWAVASDSMANRLLWAGRAVGDLDRATALAVPLARAVGAPLPIPSYVDVSAGYGQATQTVRFTRRTSCCLIYAAPSQAKCTSCPNRAPADRHNDLRRAAAQGTVWHLSELGEVSAKS